MTSILAAAALGAWSYAGFLADSAPAPPPAPPVPASVPWNPPSPPAPPSPPIDRGPASPTTSPARTAPGPGRPAPAPGLPPVSAGPSPAPRYRLADASGQVWEHADADTLRSFVQGRNQSWVVPASTPFFTYRASTCASGRCR